MQHICFSLVSIHGWLDCRWYSWKYGEDGKMFGEGTSAIQFVCCRDWYLAGCFPNKPRYQERVPVCLSIQRWTWWYCWMSWCGLERLEVFGDPSSCQRKKTSSIYRYLFRTKGLVCDDHSFLVSTWSMNNTAYLTAAGVLIAVPIHQL